MPTSVSDQFARQFVLGHPVVSVLVRPLTRFPTLLHRREPLLQPLRVMPDRLIWYFVFRELEVPQDYERRGDRQAQVVGTAGCVSAGEELADAASSLDRSGDAEELAGTSEFPDSRPGTVMLSSVSSTLSIKASGKSLT